MTLMVLFDSGTRRDAYFNQRYAVQDLELANLTKGMPRVPERRRQQCKPNRELP